MKSLGHDTELANSALKHIASLGCWGQFRGNIHRDLMNLLQSPCSPSSMSVEVPCNVSKSMPGEAMVQTVHVPFMPPHLVIHKLYTEHRTQFDKLMFGGPYRPDMLTDFWRTVSRNKDPRLAHHPMIKRPRWAELAIPISIHGDAVPCVGIGRSNTKSFDCYSWQSILSVGSSSEIKQYTFGIFEDCKVVPSPDSSACSMQSLWRAALWSFLAAYEGVFQPKI